MSWSDVPCKVWTGSTFHNGYGYRQVNGRRRRVHVLAWEEAHGPIPLGPNGRPLSVCHHCDNPACYEVQHLWLGTHAENMADMAAKGRSTRKVECVRGHPLAGDNLYVGPDGKRECKTCQRLVQRERRARAMDVLP